ncbi:ABC transporter ATP-binding protein [Zhengella mangrovi]|uniref:ABC transporter ATP-binding protein n=1 Tax=Zhengella mangrovi TaxID=1982044 RepID=A0A2G1QJM3_9HYPH|nr:ABC transporter ATP-binding protein [Zhengella mangrovi]PHP65661.1 ABC transporter ATP-binding protein [Zhengella mangrovi]
MTARNAIVARGITKTFSRSSNQVAKLWHVLSGGRSRNAFRALDGIDLEVPFGEAVGIIGRNGSGKSTLLQILYGTMEPSAGTVELNGRTSAMLELGAGFNPAFSGRENARLSAAVHGLAADEIDNRMEDIERFADIGIYFDRPLQEYSSGMFARLAFAVSSHVDASILIVDEILGVGDNAFQKKCHAFMQGFVDSGNTIVFVSHDPAAVMSLCRRAVWLENGRKAAEGDSSQVTKAYVDALYGLDGSGGDGQPAGAPVEMPAEDWQWQKSCEIEVSPFRPESPSHGFGGCVIEDCCFTGEDGGRLGRLVAGMQVTLIIRARVARRVDSPIFGFMFRDENGQNLFGDNTYLAYKDEPVSAGAGTVLEGRMQFTMPYLPVGRYSLAPSVIEGTQSNHIHLDWREEAVFLDVVRSPVTAGCLGLVMQKIEVDC